MEYKRNEATRNRPEGDRVLDAPYVFIDIEAYIDQLKDEKAWEKNNRNGITVYKSDAMTVVITVLQKGNEIVSNTVDGNFTIQLLKGKAKVSTPDGDIELKESQMICFHPGVPHTVSAIKNCTFLLSNYNRW